MFRLLSFFFFNDTATTEIYTLSLHDALPISFQIVQPFAAQTVRENIAVGAHLARASRRDALAHAQAIRSEEHTSELQSLAYLVCRLLLEKKKKKQRKARNNTTIRSTTHETSP